MTLLALVVINFPLITNENFITFGVPHPTVESNSFSLNIYENGFFFYYSLPTSNLLDLTLGGNYSLKSSYQFMGFTTILKNLKLDFTFGTSFSNSDIQTKSLGNGPFLSFYLNYFPKEIWFGKFTSGIFIGNKTNFIKGYGGLKLNYEINYKFIPNLGLFFTNFEDSLLFVLSSDKSLGILRLGISLVTNSKSFSNSWVGGSLGLKVGEYSINFGGRKQVYSYENYSIYLGITGNVGRKDLVNQKPNEFLEEIQKKLEESFERKLRVLEEKEHQLDKAIEDVMKVKEEESKLKSKLEDSLRVLHILQDSLRKKIREFEIFPEDLMEIKGVKVTSNDTSFLILLQSDFLPERRFDGSKPHVIAKMLKIGYFVNTVSPGDVFIYYPSNNLEIAQYLKEFLEVVNGIKNVKLYQGRGEIPGLERNLVGIVLKF